MQNIVDRGIQVRRMHGHGGSVITPSASWSIRMTRGDGAPARE